MTRSDELGLQWLRGIIEGRYSIIAITWLIFYEWALSVNLEVELIHKAKWTSVKIMYLLCRYLPLLLWPVVSLAYFLQAPLQIFPQAVMIMRAYAFSGRSRKILIFLSLAFLGLIAVDLWVFSAQPQLPPESFYERPGLMGCLPSYDYHEGSGLMVTRIIYAMVAATLMDGASLAVILVHCYRTRVAEVSLARYFVLQGLYAFVFSLTMNVATVATFFSQNHLHAALGLPLFLVVPNLIACRLVLQLRRKVSPTDSEISRRNSEIVDSALATNYSSPLDPWLLVELPELGETLPT